MMSETDAETSPELEPTLLDMIWLGSSPAIRGPSLTFEAAQSMPFSTSLEAMAGHVTKALEKM